MMKSVAQTVESAQAYRKKSPFYADCRVCAMRLGFVSQALTIASRLAG